MKNIVRVTAISATLLAGCSNSGSGLTGANPNADPGGIYSGTAFNDVTGVTDSVVGVIDENGEAAFVDFSGPTILRFNSIVVSGSSFTSNFTAFADTGTFADGKSVDPGTATGTVQQHSTITGTQTIAGIGGPFSLTYQPSAYETPHPFSEIAGSYTFSVGLLSATLHIDVSGNISATDSAGCTTTGTANIPNASFNAFELAVNTVCPTITYHFTGLGSYVPATGGGSDELLLEYDDGQQLGIAAMARRLPPV